MLTDANGTSYRVVSLGPTSQLAWVLSDGLVYQVDLSTGALSPDIPGNVYFTGPNCTGQAVSGYAPPALANYALGVPYRAFAGGTAYVVSGPRGSYSYQSAPAANGGCDNFQGGGAMWPLSPAGTIPASMTSPLSVGTS